MPRMRLLPLGFLLVAAISLAFPMLVGLWIGTQQMDPLHGVYYVVLPPYYSFSLVLGPVLFAITYLAGQHFAELEFRRMLVWLHLVLWVAGASLVLAPLIIIQVIAQMAQSYTVGYSVDFESLDRTLTIGYSVTLISLAVFAICIGQAILKRIRRAKPL